MSPGALHLIGEQSGGETSFSPRGGDRRSFRAQAPAPLLPGRCCPGPGCPNYERRPPSPRPAAAGPSRALRRRHTWVPPSPRVPAPAPACPTAPAGTGKAAAPSTCGGCWSRALRAGRRQPVPPQGGLALGRKAAWAGEVCWELLSNLFPVLHRYMERAGAKPWLLAAILSNTSPVQARLKRQMQNGLCTVGLARLWLREASSEAVLPTGTCGCLTSRNPVKELDLQATVGREWADLLLSGLPIWLKS